MVVKAMLGLEILLVGGVVYVARRLYEHLAAEPEQPAAESAPRADDAEATHAAASAESDGVREGHALAVTGLGLTAAGAVLWAPATLLGIGCIVYNTVDVLRGAWRKWQVERRIGAEFVDTSAVLIALGAGLYVLGGFAQWVYFVAIRLRVNAKSRLRDNLGGIVAAPPAVAWCLVGESEIATPVDRVRVGDHVIVGAGELVPVDGIVERGEAAIDQRFLTGEDQPAEKVPGDEVHASTVVLRGRVVVRVTRTGAETAAARIEAALRDTIAYEQQLELRSELVSDRTTVPTFALAAAAGVLQGVPALLGVMSSNFSSALRLLSPWSMLNYIEIAANREVLVKDGRSLETLSRVDTVVFDKTGTLTLGELKVAAIVPLGGADERAVLAYAGAVEQRQNHAIARAIVAAAVASEVVLAPATEVEYTLGHGVRAEVGGEVVFTGSQRFMHQQGIELPDAEQADAGIHSRVWVAVDSAPIGSLVLAPVVRPEARALIDRLRARGLAIHVLSGDREAPTRALAEALGIPNVHAEQLPEDKGRFIDTLHAAGRTVCFVGDGINDAIALKKAALSVSLRDAAAPAVASAQMVLLDGTLRGLADVFDLGDAFARDQRYNTVITMGSSVVCVAGVFIAHIGLATINLAFVASTGLGIAGNTIPIWRSRRRQPDDERVAEPGLTEVPAL
ncbi:heavy metal translocating P-type ATPase [Enhygromyxa salina]|uniref:P-type Zn(2+) transporter n=1 Tax=Enhygromyxa salina TaxID=215803 RepID=A0A2S9YPH5_9BACT|nr:heavy metal translocating P-type ATPase [Enhygromyxa salina]PRQ06959.1 putative copper-exporting P-type ATPase V [Enhygromyxa salina]